MNYGDMNTPHAVRVLVVGPDQTRVARAVARLNAAGLDCRTGSPSSPAGMRGRLSDPPDVIVALEVAGNWQPTVRILERDIAVSGSAGGSAAPVLVLSDGAGQREKIAALGSPTSGVWDWLEMTVTDDEIVARVQRLARIGRMTGEIRELTRRCTGMETVDRLTGIPNHRAFQEFLTAEFRRAERYASPLSLLLVDFDRFRSLNETYGHEWGDRVLQESARGVRSLLREVDLVARYGGEEFAIVLPETDATSALSVATRVRSMIEAVPSRLGETATSPDAGTPAPPRLTASVGVACCPNEATASRGRLLTAAEAALRRAKDEGRNRSVLFSTPLQVATEEPDKRTTGVDAPSESAFHFGQTQR